MTLALSSGICTTRACVCQVQRAAIYYLRSYEFPAWTVLGLSDTSQLGIFWIIRFSLRFKLARVMCAREEHTEGSISQWFLPWMFNDILVFNLKYGWSWENLPNLKIRKTFCKIWLSMILLKQFTQCFFGPGGLRAPCVLACAMRSLAIVITIVQSFSLSSSSSFSPSFAFDPLRGISRVWKFVSPNILA